MVHHFLLHYGSHHARSHATTNNLAPELRFLLWGFALVVKTGEPLFLKHEKELSNLTEDLSERKMNEEEKITKETNLRHIQDSPRFFSFSPSMMEEEA